MHLGNYYLDFPKDLRGRAHTIFEKIYEDHKLYAATFDELNKSYPVKYLYELNLIRPAYDEYPLRLLYYEVQVLKHLYLLTQNESETLVELMVSTDESNQLVGLSILKNKFKEKKSLEKKGKFAKEFNDIIINYSELIHKPSIESLLKLREKTIKGC